MAVAGELVNEWLAVINANQMSITQTNRLCVQLHVVSKNMLLIHQERGYKNSDKS